MKAGDMHGDKALQPDLEAEQASERIVATVRRWVETFVIALDLCPFAGRELLHERVRFTVTPARSEAELLQALETELELLERDPAIETTLLIHPQVLQDFDDYNQFFEYIDGLLLQMDLEGIYQVASFHPHYQFAETAQDDVENHTNRSPYPMLHLLREASLERVLAGYPNPEQIPQHNIELMRSLGRERLTEIMQTCFDKADKK